MHGRMFRHRKELCGECEKNFMYSLVVPQWKSEQEDGVQCVFLSDLITTLIKELHNGICTLFPRGSLLCFVFISVGGGILSFS